MASLVPKYVKKEIVEGYAGESLWLMLLTNAHAPNAETQRYVSDIVANEIVDSGGIYPAGGIELTGKTSQYDSANAYLDANDLQVGPGAYLTYRYGILYTKTGGASQATYRIRAHIDFLADQVAINGTSLIQWNALGIIYVS